MDKAMATRYLSKRGYVIRKRILTPQQIFEIKSDMTITPDTNQAQMGMGCVPTVQCYQENASKIYVPKFYGIKKFGPPEIDLVTPGEEIHLNYLLDLRPNQIDPVENCQRAYREHGGGTLELGCGVGKTMIALYLAAWLGRKTLVVVHTEPLVEQWTERTRTAFGVACRLGRIQGPTFDVDNKDIVIAMLPTLAMKEFPDDAFDSFGHVIFDESHRIPSLVMSRALQKLNSTYMLCLSATPERADGLSIILRLHVGDYHYQMDNEYKRQQWQPATIERWEFRSTNVEYMQEHSMFNRMKGRDVINYSLMLNQVMMYRPRIRFLAERIKELYDDPRRKILVLTKRRAEFIPLLLEELTSIGVTSVGLYVGQGTAAASKKGKARRKAQLEDSASQRVIIGTDQIASTGLDIPGLNALVFASPMRDIRQAIGRIFRMRHEGIEARVIDIIDKVTGFSATAAARRKYYTEQRYTVENKKYYDPTDTLRLPNVGGAATGAVEGAAAGAAAAAEDLEGSMDDSNEEEGDGDDIYADDRDESYDLYCR